MYNDEKIDANKPDIAIKDHKNAPCLLVELMDKNLTPGEFGKITKYKDLGIEIDQMWYLKLLLIPLVMEALVTVKKDTKQF